MGPHLGGGESTRGVWYLVAGTEAGLGTFRVGRVRSVTRTDRRVERPEGFDLEEAWRATMASLGDRRVPTTAVVRADAEVVPLLRAVLGTPKKVAKDAGSPVTVEVRGYSPEQPAAQLAGFGRRGASEATGRGQSPARSRR